MGRGGTEVARQAADVVLADDDFATLVEALVEGRSFWRNMRRALGLLLGGNLGELSLIVGDHCPGLRVSAEHAANPGCQPDHGRAAGPLGRSAAREHRNLAALAREGIATLKCAVAPRCLPQGNRDGFACAGCLYPDAGPGPLRRGGDRSVWDRGGHAAGSDAGCRLVGGNTQSDRPGSGRRLRRFPARDADPASLARSAWLSCARRRPAGRSSARGHWRPWPSIACSPWPVREG